MNKTTAMILLIVFGNLLIISLAVGQFLFWAIEPPILSITAVLVMFVVHNIAVRYSRKRYEQRFGVSARRYILLGVMPAAAICVLLLITIHVLARFGVSELFLWAIDSIPYEMFFLMLASGYSVLFLAAQFVIVAREIW